MHRRVPLTGRVSIEAASMATVNVNLLNLSKVSFFELSELSDGHAAQREQWSLFQRQTVDRGLIYEGLSCSMFLNWVPLIN